MGAIYAFECVKMRTLGLMSSILPAVAAFLYRHLDARICHQICDALVCNMFMVLCSRVSLMVNKLLLLLMLNIIIILFTIFRLLRRIQRVILKVQLAHALF